MIIDKLYEKVSNNGHVCLGLDTALDYIPVEFRNKYTTVSDMLFNFNKKIIDATSKEVACYKVQIAYYEALGMEGLKAYKDTLSYMRSNSLLVIADIKRGDIANTAEMYAKAHFEGDFESDFITVNPYMGMDSLTPYLPYIEHKEKGIFALVRTSNKGAKDIEYIENAEGKKVYELVGEKLSALGEKYMGNSGYSSIGGVMGCTHIEESKYLRDKFNKTFFLIPGFGAQGGGGKEAAVLLKNGNGGIVNSSRAILLAYKNFEDGNKNFDEYAYKKVIEMKEEIKNACKL